VGYKNRNCVFATDDFVSYILYRSNILLNLIDPEECVTVYYQYIYYFIIAKLKVKK